MDDFKQNTPPILGKLHVHISYMILLESEISTHPPVATPEISGEKAASKASNGMMTGESLSKVMYEDDHMIFRFIDTSF